MMVNKLKRGSLITGSFIDVRDTKQMFIKLLTNLNE